jgi:hypothetical protein
VPAAEVAAAEVAVAVVDEAAAVEVGDEDGVCDALPA